MRTCSFFIRFGIIATVLFAVDKNGCAQSLKGIEIINTASSSPRAGFGAGKLASTLRQYGYRVSVVEKKDLSKTTSSIIICEWGTALFKKTMSGNSIDTSKASGKE